MNKQELLKVLISDINSDLQGYNALKLLLLEQQKMILQHKSSNLVLLNELLSKKIIELESRSQKRWQIVQIFGLSMQPNSINIIINILPSKIRIKVKSMWGELENLVKDSKKINDTNGNLLSMQKESISSLLNGEQFDYGHLIS